jgi:hypothetical protein
MKIWRPPKLLCHRAILDLDAYIDFVILDDTARPLLITSSQQGTAPHQTAPGLYSVQIAPLPHGSFGVSIAQTDGRVAQKRLRSIAPSRAEKHPRRPLSCHSLCHGSTAPGVTLLVQVTASIPPVTSPAL